MATVSFDEATTMHDHQMDALRYMMEQFGASTEKYRRELVATQHPDWTAEMIDAHMALTAAPRKPAYLVNKDVLTLVNPMVDLRPGGFLIYSGNPGEGGKLLAEASMDPLALTDGQELKVEWKLDAAAQPTPAAPSPVPRWRDRLRSWLRR